MLKLSKQIVRQCSFSPVFGISLCAFANRVNAATKKQQQRKKTNQAKKTGAECESTEVDWGGVFPFCPGSFVKRA